MLNKKDENHKENSTTKQENDIWENGPASYWYNFYDLENLIEQERKKLEIEKDKQSKANIKKVNNLFDLIKRKFVNLLFVPPVSSLPS